MGRFCVPLGPRPPASEQPAFCPPLQANAACPLRPAPRPLLLPPTASTPHPRAGGSPARPLRTGKKPTVARSLPGPAGASATKAALRFRCGRAHHSPVTSRQPPPPTASLPPARAVPPPPGPDRTCGAAPPAHRCASGQGRVPARSSAAPLPPHPHRRARRSRRAAARAQESGAGRAARTHLGVAVEAVHVELRGAGHHEVALAVVEEVAVHGELQAGGRMRLLVHGVHGAEPELRGAGATG